MELNEFLEIALGLFEEAGILVQSKNKDYSKQENAFRNFDRTSQIVRALGLDLGKREHIALFEIVKKVHRLVNLGDREPQHESIKDTCLDIIVYIVLYYGMMSEGGKRSDER